MIRILTIVDRYLPGFKAGGPIRTVSNLIELLGTELQFFVLTRDRDLGENMPYPRVLADMWTGVGKAQVLYTSDLSLTNIRNRFNEVRPDIVYLNSFFSPFTVRFLLLRHLKLIPNCPVVLAPRGEFSDGALAIHAWRKKIFMTAVFGFLYKNVLWHGSTEREAAQIAGIMCRFAGRRTGEIVIARNANGVNSPAEDSGDSPYERAHAAKLPGQVRLVFLSRISRMKNLKYAIESCRRLAGDVVFDIYGPLEDPGFWGECQRVIQEAPSNVKISFCGPVPPQRVRATLRQYHFFVLPTLGENFGHVIVEALSVGCPVVISDLTPWRQLEKAGAGWDLPLEDQTVWVRALQACVEMEDSRYAIMASQALRFAQESLRAPATHEENLHLFQKALSNASTRSLVVDLERDEQIVRGDNTEG